MDINELQRFTGEDRDVTLMYDAKSLPGREWSCGLKATNVTEHLAVPEGDCVLAVMGRGATPEEAVTEAARLFDKLTMQGMPELNTLAPANWDDGEHY
jgi:hypothetical protein